MRKKDKVSGRLLIGLILFDLPDRYSDIRPFDYHAGGDCHPIDFRRSSKKPNPALKRYNLGATIVLEPRR